MDRFVRYEGQKIIIEMMPISTTIRLIVGLMSLGGLVVGLKGLFQLTELLLGFGTGNENIPVGLLMTATFLSFSIVGILLALDSGKVLSLDPRTKEAHLTKRYLSKIVERRFPFQSLDPCFVEEDVDLNGVWHVKIKLPDKTRMSAITSKNASEMWRDRINVMIGKT